MKYLWLIIIVLLVLIWSVASIIDLIWAIKEEGIFYGIYECADYFAQVWLALVFLGIFLYSFMLYVGGE